MRSRTKWLTILFVLICMVSGCALAETPYHVLCTQNGISSADVIAWLDIPSASICTPVMRHPKEDAYYAKHDPYGTASETGSVYVQAGYNAADFSDPVTLIYGSSLSETTPFGRLQELYSGSFEQHTKLYVHLPEETCEYVVFAALPYASIHILHYYDFSNAKRHESFFESVYSSRVLGMHLDEANRPEEGKDEVIILSTGLRGDSLQRYLVMARKASL